mmetsp:Transcript_160230/g.282646  ORF Transcript_160230/g.282646 Transcript_160230/m.282646 type:complete len:453 (+) Transcript_160230:96-1454(+)
MSTCANGAHGGLPLEAEFNELSVLMQSGRPIQKVVQKAVQKASMATPLSAVQAIAAEANSFQETVVIILHWLAARGRLCFALLCLGVMMYGASKLQKILSQRDSTDCCKETKETKTEKASDRPCACHGFTTVFDWVCPSSGRCLIGNQDELREQQKQFRRRTLTLAIIGALSIMTMTLLVGERIGSLALLGDGIHLFGDVATYSVLLFAEVASSSWHMDMKTYSYGYGRLEVLFTFAALSGQYYAICLLVYGAVGRLQNPEQLADYSGEIIFSLGIVSLFINAGLGSWMHFKGVSIAHDHSAEGGAAAACAKVHLLCDAAQNLIVILTGGLMWSMPRLTRLEPICTLMFVALFFWSTFGFWTQMLDILMERTPRSVNCKALHDDLCKVKGVVNVHCLHVWALAPGKICASAHICTEDSDKNEDVLHRAQIILQHRYGIKHSTLQVSDSDDVM